MLRYAITGRTRFPGDESTRQAALREQAVHLTSQGIDFLQVREKDLEAGALTHLARQLLTTLRGTPTPTTNYPLTTTNCPSNPTHPAAHPAPKLLINSRADIAIAVGADGVHLTSAVGELTPAQIRQLYAAANLPTPITSLSCHTLAVVARIAASPAEDRPTMILFGPVFEKVIPNETRSDTLIFPGTGLDLLQQACTLAAPIPVLALGGITPENTAACLTAGATGIAAIRLFVEP